jgi:hypothetical protein
MVRFAASDPTVMTALLSFDKLTDDERSVLQSAGIRHAGVLGTSEVEQRLRRIGTPALAVLDQRRRVQRVRIGITSRRELRKLLR